MLPSHSAILTGAISTHRIFTHMYSTVSIGPSYIESLTRFSHIPPPLMAFPTYHHRTSSFRCLPIISKLNQKRKSLTKKNLQKNTKVFSYPSLPGNDPDTPHLKFDSLTIRPLTYVLFVTPKPLYN